MIDYLIRFEDQYDLNTFNIVLPEDAILSDKSVEAMVGDVAVTVLAVEIVNNKATYDSEGNELAAQGLATGNWIVVRTRQEFPDWQLDPRLVIITNVELVNEGQAFVVWKNDLYPWEAMQGRVSPTFAGSHYPFGPHMNADQLITSS